MKQELRLFFTALQYFTRIPVPRWVGHSAEQLEGASRYFPLVGILVGGLGALVLALATAWLTPVAAVLLSMLTTVMLTGAFHEDGLADSADGLYGGWTVEDRLRIMKDSRIGTFGVLALLLVLGIKAAALTGLPWPLALVAMPVAHGVSRGWAVWAMQCLAYVREDESSRAKPIARQISAASLAVATCCAAGPAILLAWWTSKPIAVAVACLASLLAFLWMLRLLRHKLGGYTGDGLGATQQTTEVAFYLGLLGAWPLG